MSYTKPLAAVYQEFLAVTSATTRPLRAFLLGPHYQLVRCAKANEKLQGLLGAYVPDTDTAYAWPNRAAGAVVDQDYSGLFIDSAKLQYFTSADVTSAGIIATYCDGTVGGHKNRVRAAKSGLNWKTYGTDVRHTLLKNRDVQVGDKVTVSGVVDAEVVELDTYVTGFIHDRDPSAIAEATADAANQANTVEGATVTPAGAYDGYELIATPDASGYDGLADGDVTETYVITVVQGGAAGVATLRVRSASGLDDADDVVTAALGEPLAIGDRGLEVTWDGEPTSSSSSGEADFNEFVTGQVWTVVVTQAYTKATFASAGTYTGPADTTYVVEVLTGGLLETAQVKVSTTTGIDSTGPVTTAASTVANDIGAYGVTLAFTGDALVKGDRFYIPATAEAQGAVKTLVLGHNLPASLLGLVEGVCDTEPDLTVVLTIQKNIEVSRNRTGHAPDVNFSTSTTEVSVKAGILGYDASWVDNSGELLDMPVISGTVYVQYRAFRQEYVGAIHDASVLDDIADLGATDYENTLPYALTKAIGAANGTTVKYTAVADNSIESYAAALRLGTIRQDVYSIVPLTYDRDIQNACFSHAVSMSGPAVGRWRKVFACSQVAAQKELLASSNDAPIRATITENPSSELSPKPVTYVELALGNGQAVDLYALQVKLGDIVRCAYEDDGFGTMTYTEYVVDAVQSADSLLLTSGPSAEVGTAAKIEIWRTLDADGVVSELVAASGSFSSRRAHNIWPDVVTSNGVAVPGYHLAAAIAGLISGVVPHQGLTRLPVPGFDSVPRTTRLLSEDQLDTIAAAGTWIVTQDPVSGNIYTRHALTTDMSDVNTQEEMKTRNGDSVSYYLLELLEPFIGRTNVTTENLEYIDTTIRSGLSFLSSGATSTRTLGPQILGYDPNLQIATSATMPDRIVAVVKPVWPYPMNGGDIHLVIG